MASATRHSPLAGTMRRRAMSVAAIEAALLAENAAHCTPPLPESEVRAIADSVSRYAPAGESNQETDVQQCSFSRGRSESRADGILFIGTDKEGEDQAARWICGPLQVLAKTRDTKSSSWGRLLEWFDADGVRYRWAMPLELLQGDGWMSAANSRDKGFLLRQGAPRGICSRPFFKSGHPKIAHDVSNDLDGTEPFTLLRLDPSEMIASRLFSRTHMPSNRRSQSPDRWKTGGVKLRRSLLAIQGWSLQVLSPLPDRW